MKYAWMLEIMHGLGPLQYSDTTLIYVDSVVQHFLLVWIVTLLLISGVVLWYLMVTKSLI